MKKKKRKIFYLVLGILLFISILLNTYLILKYKVLPNKYLVLYGLFVILIPLLLISYTLFKKRKSKVKALFACFEFIYIIALFLVFFYLNSTFDFLSKFTTSFDYETKKYYVLVLKNGDYNTIEDINGKKVGYTNGLDTSINSALDELNKKAKVESKELDGYNEAFNSLDSKSIDAVLIFESYYNTLVENDENSKYDEYQVIYEFSVKEKAQKLIKDVNVLKEPFNVYISGIDTYGSVAEQTRSDVNIIMNINPVTHKILLVNIPRDYYVDLAGKNAKDKLTHAGSYGVATSVKTLENLLDIEINYYIKVNYNALIKLVDALDGVDVYSEYDFRSYEFHHRFTKGMNHVNGKYALDFVRTRKAFANGDRVRGENQQRMIEAIIKKACSPSVLLKYDSILKSLDGNFVTNMPMNNVISIINMQLDKMPSWEVDKISLNGSDSYEYTYSAQNQELYVMIPNEETVNSAKDALKANSEK